MALTWTEDPDSRQNLGMSGIIQQNTASFSLSDYTSSGYAVNPAAFGMGVLHGLIPLAYTGTAAQYEWRYRSDYGTLEVFSAGTQVSPGTDLSGGTVKLLAYGF